MIATSSRLKVLTLMPPAVEPEAPPTNIKAIETNRAASDNPPVGTTAKPAERTLVEWKKALSASHRLRHRAERRRVLPLECPDEHGPTDEEGGARDDHDLRLHGERPPASLQCEIADDRVSEASQHDRDAERAEHDDVVRERREAAKIASEVEPRVHERGDGVERPPPDPADQVAAAAACDERSRQHQRRCAFDDEREDRDPADDRAGAAEIDATHRLLDHHAVPETRAATDHDHQEQRRPGHDAEAAGLDQREDHDVAEGAPVRRGIDHDQPADADGGCRGEQRIDQRRHRAGAAGDRQHQQRGADRHRSKEAVDRAPTRPAGGHAGTDAA